MTDCEVQRAVRILIWVFHWLHFSRPFKTFQDLSRFVKTFQDLSRTFDKLSNVYPRLDFSRPMVLALQRLSTFTQRWGPAACGILVNIQVFFQRTVLVFSILVRATILSPYSSEHTSFLWENREKLFLLLQVSLMSHSCVGNLEVVNPPSRSIAFKVKRPVSLWQFSSQNSGLELMKRYDVAPGVNSFNAACVAQRLDTSRKKVQSLP